MVIEKKPTMLDGIQTLKPTPRVERLRESFLSLKPSASIDRARIETRVMKETEGEPVITRRAKVFAATVREMPINICPDQLLTGSIGVRPRCANITPANKNAAGRKGFLSYLLGLSEDAPFGDLSDDQKRELEELTPYWKEQGRMGKVFHYGHNIHGHVTVLKKGFLGIKREAEERLARLDLAEAEDIAKVPFLEGVVMAMEAAAEIGKRYAARARELAGIEEDGKRKEELLRMAEVCGRVPANPARTFCEALQSYYFSYMLLHWEVVPSMGFSQGRLDQYFYPYYERDIREGRITKEEAQELIDCYFLGVNYEGEDSPITVGGVKANGRDATNELSYMLIESSMHTRLPSPWLSVLVHNKMPDDLLIKACRLSSLGTGQPQFVNNDVMVDQALARGTMGGPPITLEDARAASPQGCFELVIPGKDSGYLYFPMPNLAACMELVMTNGGSRSGRNETGPRKVPGRRYNAFQGTETGDPEQFESFEEVQEAFRKQLAWMRRNIQIFGTKTEREIIEFTPTVYESALIEGCIEKGICREEGGAHYNFNNGGAPLGTTDAADSLTAIKMLVFDEKKTTMAELCDALDHDFEGYEELHQMLLKAPKFGNDDDYADEQMAWVLHEWMEEFNQVKNLRGGRGCPGGSVMGAYVPEGKRVGALPSGRPVGTPLVDASSPSPGKDLKGPTAVVNSMGKVDHVEILGGVTFNLRIDPSVFKDGDVNRLAGLIRTFVDQKIFHMQINVVSSDTLRAAQIEPDKYNDLVVKVAGYNAFFTQLNKPLQDTIIARTEHGL
jgi:formate C-acetyltransferase